MMRVTKQKLKSEYGPDAVGKKDPTTPVNNGGKVSKKTASGAIKRTAAVDDGSPVTKKGRKTKKTPVKREHEDIKPELELADIDFDFEPDLIDTQL